MDIQVHRNKEELGRIAARQGADRIREALKERGEAIIIVATGASQFEMLNALVKEDLDWSRVTGFHLDEYIGLSLTHPASFRKYLKERFVQHTPLKEFHYVNGEGDPVRECERLAGLIREEEVDVAFIGIGENGHLAFNDPPADLVKEEPFLVLELDRACRLQQVNEGWFPSLGAVPRTAISMSVVQILKSRHIICTVPDERKAKAVRCTVEGSVNPNCPASALQDHPSVSLFLDPGSSSLLGHRRKEMD